MGNPWKASTKAPDEMHSHKAEYTVNAKFVRFLVLGGDDDAPVHERGVHIEGAYIKGSLDFTGCKGMRVFRAINCRIDGDLTLEVASTSSLYLDGSRVGRIVGNRAEINGSLYLRFGFVAEHGLDLSGSHVTGSISCRGGTFRPGPPSDDEPVAYTFRMDDAEIAGALVFGARHADDDEKRNLTKLKGIVSLQGTTCAALIDHPDTYKEVNAGQLRLHGFRYGRLAGVRATEIEVRKDWLRKATPHSGFSQQTYDYLAGVLREMGHEDEARQILIERQVLQRASINRARQNIAARVLGLIVNCSIHVFVRYGYEPWRAIFWSLLPIAVGCLVFGASYRLGHIIPSNYTAATGPAWQACQTTLADRAKAEDEGGAVEDRAACLEIPNYPKFNPLWYSFDTFVPILSIRQEDYWAPAPNAPVARNYLNLHVILGWLLITLGLSSTLGLVQRRGVPGGR